MAQLVERDHDLADHPAAPIDADLILQDGDLHRPPSVDVTGSRGNNLLPTVLRSKLRVTFAGSMPLEIAPAASRAEVRRFVDVPWRIPALSGAPQWVPPLRIAVHDALDERRNPFYRRATRQLFVALRDGRPVGRIAVIENRAHNEFHSDRVGFFGFFDSVD